MSAVGNAGAVFDDIGHGPVTKKLNLDLDSLWERYDAALVNIDARLIRIDRQPYGASLLLQHGATLFEARLQPSGPNDLPISIPLDSEVRVTGICLVRSGGL